MRLLRESIVVDGATFDSAKLLRRSAHWLTDFARGIKAAYTVRGEWTEHSGNAKREYDTIMKLAADCRAAGRHRD